MVLGVYWYFHFPEGLYSFRYFTFSAGLGGHADGPAELTARVTVLEPARFAQALTALLARHPDVYFFAYQRGHDFQLVTGDYHLFDYYFELVAELDALLQQENAQPNPAATFTEADCFIRQRPTTEAGPPLRGLLQLGGSRQGKHHAETSALRLDCHLKTARLPPFITALRELTQAANLRVFYYFFHQVKDDTNLMLFFTNGRQGVGGQPRQEVDIQLFEQQVAEVLQAHGGKPEHRGGYHQYPEKGPVVELVIDQDYVL